MIIMTYQTEGLPQNLIMNLQHKRKGLHHDLEQGIMLSFNGYFFNLLK